MTASKAPRKINPRSRLKVVGRQIDGKPRVKQERRRVSDRCCPRCSDWMYADQIIDIGTIEVNGIRHTGRHHRTCEEKTS